MNTETVFIGFGTNQGDRHEFCDRAITLMGLLPHSQLIDISSYYETEPLDPAKTLGPTWFYNGIVRIATCLTPISLLEICQESERALGRSEENRAGPRSIDFDILFYGQQKMTAENLTIPHPRLHLRRFVLVPMVELAPDWNHPVLTQSMQYLLDTVADTGHIHKLDLIPGSKYGNIPTGSTRHS